MLIQARVETGVCTIDSGVASIPQRCTYIDLIRPLKPDAVASYSPQNPLPSNAPISRILLYVDECPLNVIGATLNSHHTLLVLTTAHWGTPPPDEADPTDDCLHVSTHFFLTPFLSCPRHVLAIGAYFALPFPLPPVPPGVVLDPPKRLIYESVLIHLDVCETLERLALFGFSRGAPSPGVPEAAAALPPAPSMHVIRMGTHLQQAHFLADLTAVPATTAGAGDLAASAAARRKPAWLLFYEEYKLVHCVEVGIRGARAARMLGRGHTIARAALLGVMSRVEMGRRGRGYSCSGRPWAWASYAYLLLARFSPYLHFPLLSTYASSFPLHAGGFRPSFFCAPLHRPFSYPSR